MEDPKKITREEMWSNFMTAIIEVPKLVNKAKPDFRPIPFIHNIKQDAILQVCSHYLDSVQIELKDILMILPETDAYLLLNHLNSLNVGIGLGLHEKDKVERLENWYKELGSKYDEKNKR